MYVLTSSVCYPGVCTNKECILTMVLTKCFALICTWEPLYIATVNTYITCLCIYCICYHQLILAPFHSCNA